MVKHIVLVVIGIYMLMGSVLPIVTTAYRQKSNIYRNSKSVTKDLPESILEILAQNPLGLAAFIVWTSLGLSCVVIPFFVKVKAVSGGDDGVAPK